MLDGNTATFWHTSFAGGQSIAAIGELDVLAK